MAQLIIREKEWIRINPQDKTKLEYSTTDGKNWNSRYKSSIGDILDLIDNGKEVLAQTSKGMFYSTTECRNFNRRH